MASHLGVVEDRHTVAQASGLHGEARLNRLWTGFGLLLVIPDHKQTLWREFVSRDRLRPNNFIWGNETRLQVSLLMPVASNVTAGLLFF